MRRTRMRARPSALLGGSGGSSGSGGTTGGGTCGAVRIETPILTVVDQATGSPICDAVSNDDGGPGLYPCGMGSSCTGKCPYTVGPGSSSSFSLGVTAPGYAPATVHGLMVRYCGCGSTSCQPPQKVEVMLLPLRSADGGSG